MPTKHILILVFICGHILSCACKMDKNSVALIPLPWKVEWRNENLKFSYINIDAARGLENEQEFVRKYFNVKGNENSVKIKLELSADVLNPWRLSGAYQLIINDDIEIIATDAAGIFYGIQTLKQLVEKKGGTYCITKCIINDWPAFKIRGFMHDVGRNYQTPELLKEQIDVLAAYKYNVFHMHITDNPGWRLESKLYPQLQSEEATSRKPGMFYTQEEFKDLVEYCRQRHITLIPELDIPGHTEAFRKALGIYSMNTSEVQNILLELIDELCALAPAEVMPYIHLGTDEVRHRAEHVDRGYLVPLIKRVEENGRKYISWWHGIQTPGDTTSIKQLWAQHEPLSGHPFIDSRANYINHLDPLAGIGRLYFQQPCRAEHGDSMRLGGILCCWPDDRVDEERNIVLQNAVYSFMVAYSESIWRGVKSTGKKYWAQLPQSNTSEYHKFKDFESRISIHRNRYFINKEFPFVKNAHIPWRIIGPFNHNGDFLRAFYVEEEIKSSYTVEGENFSWRDSLLYGGTIHLNHFFGFPSPVKEKEGTVYALNYLWSPKEQELDFWIGFQGWSRAGGRRGGPTPSLGQWHTTNPKIWVNENEIAPPVWKKPGLAAGTTEIPFVDEDYFYREPTKLKLKKGWNKFLLKIPQGGNSWKWMFTCVPVLVDGCNIREVERIKYSTDINSN